MDYSQANVALWNSITQIGIIAITILVANILRRKVPFIKKSMIPTAVLGGFLLLFLKLLNVIRVDNTVMEMITYHGIAIGFIALSLRVPDKTEKKKGDFTGLKSGAVIVSSYMVQGALGLAISLGLAYTFMPDLFKACGILLPMGYGQGPGQANNVGSTYESLGFAGGRSFGLAIAAAGYICACIVGVIYINMLARKGKIKKVDHDEIAGSVTIDTFQTDNEMPISESLDRLSMQVAMVLAIYLCTYLLSWGVTSLLASVSPGLANTVNSLIWGFNFMIGSGLAILTRTLLKKMKDVRIMGHQYQNNYLLSRISGLAFDVMIIAGIASIEIQELSGLWVPFILLSVVGAFATLWHLRFVCKKVYPDYYYEALTSMYGMMTGTISSGILLLRELDPQMETPAANNLVIGSSFAILLGAPLLILISLAPQSDTMTFIVLLLVIVYYAIQMFIVCKKPKKKNG